MSDNLMLKKQKNIYQYLIVAGIICFSVAVYWNSLGNDFVNWDDIDLIVRNNYIKTLSFQNIKAIFTPGVVGAYQPIRTLSYAIDYHFWKLDPTGYHITNILCHACSTLLVYLIAYALARDFLLACQAAVLFAIHPIHVEAVTWLSGRRDVLSAALALLSCYSYLQFSRRSSLSCYVLSLLLFTLALLTKLSVVILPLVIVLYEISFHSFDKMSSKSFMSQLWGRVVYSVPFFLIAVGITRVVTTLSKASGVVKPAYHGGSAYMTFLTMSRVFAEYIYMLLIPKNLSTTYGVTLIPSFWHSAFLIAFVGLLIVLGLTIVAWRRSKIVFFGICWFFFGLIPVSNILPISTVKADRYLYFPSVGFYLILAWLIIRGWQALKNLKGTVVIKWLIAISYWLLIGVIVLTYTLLTIQRNRNWKDSHTLWTATLGTTPNSTIALNNLGRIYAAQGMYEKAIALYERILEVAPDQDKIERVYGNLADAYAGMQMFDQALDYYEKSLETNPEYVEAYLGLGKISMELGQYEKSAGIYQYAAAIDPQNEAVYNQLGNLAFIQGEYDEAIAHYQHAKALNPWYIEAYNGLGLSYAAKGESNAALMMYQQALQLDPKSAVIHNSLGSLYMSQGNVARAIFEFREGLKYDPNNAEVRNNLGLLYLQSQQYKEAFQEFTQAVQLQPDNPKILSNLALLYAQMGLFEEAIQFCQQALELDPSLFQMRVLLGDLCFAIGQITCAVEAYQLALALQPDNDEVLQKLTKARKQQE